MGALEGIVKQIRDLFGSMTISARIMAALMAGVIVLSLGWILTTQQSGQMEYLFGGRQFSEDELNLAERALGEAGLRKYEREGARIRVPTLERDLYLKALSEGGAVPQEWGDRIEKALSSSNPFEAQSMIDKRISNARQVELARTLESMPGVEHAMVTYDEKRAGFARNATQTASVILKGVGKQPIDMDTMRAASDTTTAWFAGLKPEIVTVTDVNSRVTYRASSDPNSVDQQPYLQAQRMWEEKYTQKIRSHLSNFGDPKIAVHVDLDPTLKRESEKVKFDPVGVAMESSTSKKDSKSSKPQDGGRPGAESGASLAMKPQAISNNAAQTSEVKETTEDQKSVIGHESTLVKEAPLTLKRVSVSINIAESFITKLAMDKFLQANPGKAEKDMPALTDIERDKLKKDTEKSVKDSVLPLLPPVREGDDRYPLVSVNFNTDFPVPPLPKPGLAENAMTWFGQSWSTLGLFAMLGMSMMMMFTWVRAQTATEREKQFTAGFGLEVPASMSDSLELGDGEGEKKEEEESGPTFEITGGQIKEELSNLVKQNPDAAVNLLRTWIGEAA